MDRSVGEVSRSRSGASEGPLTACVTLLSIWFGYVLLISAFSPNCNASACRNSFHRKPIRRSQPLISAICPLAHISTPFGWIIYIFLLLISARTPRHNGVFFCITYLHLFSTSSTIEPSHCSTCRRGNRPGPHPRARFRQPIGCAASDTSGQKLAEVPKLPPPHIQAPVCLRINSM